MKNIIIFMFVLFSCSFILSNCQNIVIEKHNYIYDFLFKTNEKYDNILISIGDCVAVGSNKTANITLSQVEFVDICNCKYSIIPSINVVIIYDIMYFMLVGGENNKTEMGAKMFSITENMNKKRFNSYSYIDFFGGIFID